MASPRATDECAESRLRPGHWRQYQPKNIGQRARGGFPPGIVRRAHAGWRVPADVAAAVTGEGPKGTAEIIEVFVDVSNNPEYEVRFQDKVHVHTEEGAASIDACELVGK